MYVKQILNNNAVISLMDKDEVVIIGTGIGFHKKVGDEIHSNEIDKTFILSSHRMVEDFGRLMSSASDINLMIVDKVTSYATEVLDTVIHDFVYLAFLEHIGFAIERWQKGIRIKSPLSYDVKRFYQKEYMIGQYAVKLINETHHLDMDDEEAVQVALHFVNNQSANSDNKIAVKMTEIVSDIIHIIKLTMQVEIDESKLDSQRLITHLQHFAKRILQENDERREETEIDKSQSFYLVTQKCIDAIEAYLVNSYHYAITNDERLYLAIHISRIIQK